MFEILSGGHFIFCVFYGLPGASIIVSQSLSRSLLPAFEHITSTAMAQGDTPTESHDLEKANVVVEENASQEHSSHEESSSSSASVDGEKQAQSTAESVDTNEAGQPYLVSS